MFSATLTKAVSAAESEMCGQHSSTSVNTFCSRAVFHFDNMFNRNHLNTAWYRVNEGEYTSSWF